MDDPDKLETVRQQRDALAAALREVLRTHEAESESAENARFDAEQLLKLHSSVANRGGVK